MSVEDIGDWNPYFLPAFLLFHENSIKEKSPAECTRRGDEIYAMHITKVRKHIAMEQRMGLYIFLAYVKKEDYRIAVTGEMLQTFFRQLSYWE